MSQHSHHTHTDSSSSNQTSSSNVTSSVDRSHHLGNSFDDPNLPTHVSVNLRTDQLPEVIVEEPEIIITTEEGLQEDGMTHTIPDESEDGGDAVDLVGF